MILELVIAVFMLGGSTHQIRQQAFEELTTSKYTYLECRKVYDHKDIQIDPEIRLSLRLILYYKYSEEFGSLHTDYYDKIDEASLKAAFEREMRFGSE